MNKVWTGKINTGKLILNDQQGFKNFIQSSKNRPVELIIRSPYKRRTNEQNKYYWSVVVKLLANETGYSSDEMHGVLKWIFAKRLDTNTTCSMSTVEFSDAYIEAIREWAMIEFNLYIPLPNEIEE